MPSFTVVDSSGSDQNFPQCTGLCSVVVAVNEKPGGHAACWPKITDPMDSVTKSKLSQAITNN